MPTNQPLRCVAQWALSIALALPLTPLWMGSAQPVFSAAAPLGATVSVLSLPVDVANTEPGSSFGPAIDGQTLFEGDIIRTGPGGMALVTFFDGSESQLGGESQVQIEQVRANPAPQIAFLQTAGVTVNHIIPMPAGGSFRTDTPAATGIVRGTSYIVVVGSATASMILLTDRNGHVGRVDVTPTDSTVPAVQLASAGDCVAASSSSATPAHLDPAALAQLESVAHIRGDTNASLTTEQDARAIVATFAAAAVVAPAPPTESAAVVSPTLTIPAPAPTASNLAEGSTSSESHAESVAPPKASPVTIAPPPPHAVTSTTSTSETPGKSDKAASPASTTASTTTSTAQTGSTSSTSASSTGASTASASASTTKATAKAAKADAKAAKADAKAAASTASTASTAKSNNSANGNNGNGNNGNSGNK